MDLKKLYKFQTTKKKSMNLKERKNLLIKKIQKKSFLISFDDILKYEDMKKVLDIIMLDIIRS